MMKKDNFTKNTKKCMLHQENYMVSFRNNVETYAKEKHLTVQKISEISDIPYATLNTFLYGKTNDCKLSTAIKLARAFGVSIDELVDAKTVTEMQMIDLKRMRDFPQRIRYLFHWLIEYHSNLLQKKDRKKQISVLIPEIKNGTEMFFSYQYYLVDISECSDEIKAKAYIGLKLTGENYMPKYVSGDILLIANNRIDVADADYVIIYYGRIYLTKRIENKPKSYSFLIEDGGFQVGEDEVDGILGYVTGIVYQ